MGPSPIFLMGTFISLTLFDDVKLNVKEELIDSTSENQDILFLSIKLENNCEFF